MSNTSSIVSIAVAWAGTAGGGVAVLRKYTTKAENYISHVEAEVNSVLAKLEVLDTKLSTLISTPTPKTTSAKVKKVVKKTAEPKKRLR